jgi:peroxiredoxin
LDIGFALTALGLLFVAAGGLAYLVLLFAVHGFTYRTWMFHGVVLAGMALALVGWVIGGSVLLGLAAEMLGIVWFVVAWRELSLSGSKRLAVRRGDPMPAFTASTTDRLPFTERDLVAAAPALLVMYRGWWCPSSKAQLDEVVQSHEELAGAGVTVFAGSVDGPDEAAHLQRHVGDRITILCDIPTSLLDTIGVRDERGAPWYDRLLFGAARRDISMPAALVIDDSGRIVYAHRSTRVDDRPRPAEILERLTAMRKANAMEVSVGQVRQRR